MQKFSEQKNKGFTLVESLVAITIILTAITGTFAVAQGGLRASSLAKERVTAYFLAQESIEMVKNARDHNNLERYSSGGSAPDWLEDIATPGDPCETPNICDWRINFDDVDEDIVGTSMGEFKKCEDINNCLLKQRSDGIFNYDEGTDTSFYRILTVDEIVPNQEAKVTVTVSWREGSQRVIISENIFNWSVAQ